MVQTIQEILRCKRDGEEWSEENILFFIKAVTAGNIDKSQIGASLMAIYLKGNVSMNVYIVNLSIILIRRNEVLTGNRTITCSNSTLC